MAESGNIGINMKKLRLVLLTVGVSVWFPYMYLKYLIHKPFPVWIVLVIHIPCMVAALVLRFIGNKKPPGS